MPRFRLESPRPCTIFCFALIHYARITPTNTFLLVSSSVRSKQLLCFVHGQGQKREQKPTTKKFIKEQASCPFKKENYCSHR